MMDMSALFNANFFKGNRQALRSQVDGLLIFTANGLLQRSGDTTFPFRQDSNFWYLTGVNEPDVILVMDGAEEYLIVPSRGAAKQIFDGSIDTAKLSQISGITEILDEKEGWHRLGAAVRQAKTITTCRASDSYISQVGIFTNPARQRLLHHINECLDSEVTLQDVRPLLAVMRMHKQEPEIQAIQRAITSTTDAFRSVMKQRRMYISEYEVQADLTRYFIRAGGQHAYEPIVAGGLRACTLHYTANNLALDTAELVLIDAGAELEGYAADITRTLALRRPSVRQKAVHTAVRTVQEFAYAQLKPGVLLKEYEQKVEQKMGQELQKLKLITSINREAVRHYYPHATSHFLGLDVHDVADYAKPLQSGMVLTVEPGIYIPEESIGIRIEDDVLITDKGIEVLSKDLPSGLA